MTATALLTCCKTFTFAKSTRARNVVFKEKIVVGFSNGLREEENGFLFDVTFEDQTEAVDNENGVLMDIKEAILEMEIKPQVLADEERS